MEIPFFAIAIAGVTVCGFGAIVSLITLIVSTLSWIIIPKWRTFKNYVFLNIIFAFNAIYCLPIGLLFSDFFSEHKLIFIALDIVMNFFMFASCCWLMVMAMLFYTDLVIVFGSTMTRKVLKCNVFGWGLPLIVSIGKVINKTVILMYNHKLLKEDIVAVYHDYFYYEEIVQNIVMIILLGVNFSVYVKVVFSLLRNLKIRSSENRIQKVQMATLAFIMSGILLMVSILMTIVMLIGKKDKYYLYPLGLAMFGIQTTVINICFLKLKANRIIWKKYLDTLSRHVEKQEDKEHEMFENVKLNK